MNIISIDFCLQKVFYCFIILFLSITVKAQSDFAPIGAKWYYDSMNSGQAPFHSEYFLYESNKDTLIDTTHCKKIVIDKYAYNGNILHYSPLFIYGDTNKVFYFNTRINKFCILYDFDVIAGDTLTLNSPSVNYFPGIPADSLFQLYVDTVYYRYVTGRFIKFIYTTPIIGSSGYSFSFWGPYCQYVGGLNMMLPQPTPNIPEIDGPLRCYQDSIISFENNWILPCDYRITGTEEINENYHFIYNSDNSSLLYDVGGNKSRLNIFNLYGENKMSVSITGKGTLDISTLNSGFYIAVINFEKNIIKTFIKQ